LNVRLVPENHHWSRIPTRALARPPRARRTRLPTRRLHRMEDSHRRGHRSRTAAGRSDLAYSSSTRKPQRSLQCDLFYLDTVGVRAERSAPTTYAASVSISSCRTNRTDSRIRPAPSRHEPPPATPTRQTGATPSAGSSSSVCACPSTLKIPPMDPQPHRGHAVDHLKPHHATGLRPRTLRSGTDKLGTGRGPANAS
jgi:hypothetical protein